MVCWLIEKYDGPALVYWSGRRKAGEEFTVDPNWAVRFSRAEDAEQVRVHVANAGEHSRSVQHAWSQAPPEPSPTCRVCGTAISVGDLCETCPAAWVAPTEPSASVEDADALQSVWDAAWAMHDPVPNGRQWERSRDLKDALDAFEATVRAQQAEQMKALQEQLAAVTEELESNRACNLYTWKERALQAEASLAALSRPNQE